MSVTIAGEAAAIRWGYHVAGTVGAWTVTGTGTALTLSASLVSQDTFRLSQRPLVFVVTRQGGVSWRWPILDELQIAGASLSGTLGPKEC